MAGMGQGASDVLGREQETTNRLYLSIRDFLKDINAINTEEAQKEP